MNQTKPGKKCNISEEFRRQERRSNLAMYLILVIVMVGLGVFFLGAAFDEPGVTILGGIISALSLLVPGKRKGR